MDAKQFVLDHKKEIAMISIPVAGAAVVSIVAPAVVKTAGALVFTGACLAIGFWAGKKVTNAADAAWYTRDSKIDEIAKELGIVQEKQDNAHKQTA